MPNLITHKIFGEDVIKLTSSKIKHYVSKNPQAFSVGTSGPDFLFYYSKLPWQNQKKGKQIRNIGSLIHQKNINDWYRVAIKTCLKETNLEIKEQMISFMIGHLTHWALDSSVHPFIFYRTGSNNKQTPYGHYRYESMLDTVMVNKYRKQSIKNYPSKEILKTTPEIELAIYKVYKDAVEETFEIKFKEEYVNKSFTDANKILNVLYDPLSIKFKVIRIFEMILNKKWQITSHIVTDKVKDDVDVLNINHHTWKNPAKPSFKSNESFLDLYYKAIDLAVSVIKEFENVIEGQPIDKLLAIIANKSYETGLSEKKVMKEFKSVY